MPLYDYKCEVCGHIREVKLHFDELDKNAKLICPKCGHSMSREINAEATVLFKGSGWAKDNYEKRGGKIRGEDEK